MDEAERITVFPERKRRQDCPEQKRRNGSMRSDGRKKKFANGSVTVEASLIVPIVVLLTALLIVMTFYVHNRCWYRCAALETAIEGNSRDSFESGNEEQRAVMHARRRISDQVMPGSEAECSVSVAPSASSVSFSGQKMPLFQSQFQSFSIREEVQRIQPESFLRKLWAAEGLKDALTEPRTE